MFIEAAFTVDNCQGDICPGNICPSNIFQPFNCNSSAVLFLFLIGNYSCPRESNSPRFPTLDGNQIFFSRIGRTKTFFNFPQLCSPKFFSKCTSVTIPMS